MSAQATAVARVPFRAADSFVLALDDFRRRTRQGGHVSQSVLELDAAPDLDRLRAGSTRLLAKHPLLVARPRRAWTTGLPYWAVGPPPCGSLPLALGQEMGADAWQDSYGSAAAFAATPGSISWPRRRALGSSRFPGRTD